MVNATDYLIDNGKIPSEPFNARFGIWLPPDSPYGNFQLKYIKIIYRLDEANRSIMTCCNNWNRIMNTGGFSNYDFSGELIVYHLRKTCDELISLSWCLHYYLEHRDYPNKIEIDSIGGYLYDKKHNYRVFDDFTWILTTLNDISNAYKHSFINSDLVIIGRDEPCLPALSLDHNNLHNPPQLYNVSLKEITIEYNRFFRFAKTYLSESGARIRENQK